MFGELSRVEPAYCSNFEFFDGAESLDAGLKPN
jgi:hypothetical protein